MVSLYSGNFSELVGLCNGRDEKKEFYFIAEEMELREADQFHDNRRK